MGDSAKTFRVLPGTPAARRGLWAVPLAVLLLVSTDASAARVKGTVSGFQFLVNPVWEESKDPDRHSFSFREPVPTVRGEFRRLFPHIPKELCIAALGAAAQPAQKPILIRIGGGRTTPVTIVVTPGTQLQFQNTDPFPHRLFAVGVPTFSPGDTVKGGVRSWSVPGPGTFEIRDEAAPSLRMFVVGEPNVASISYPSMKGEFAVNFENPGDYRLQAFFGGKKVGPEVPVKVDAKDVDLKAPIKVGEESKDKDKDKSDKPDKGDKGN